MLLVTLAAIAGGVLTGICMWPAGILVAIASAPIGGSLAALLAGLLIALRRPAPADCLEAMNPSTPVSPDRPLLDLPHRSEGPQPV
jgi:hypothetical protein